MPVHSRRTGRKMNKRILFAGFIAVILFLPVRGQAENGVKNTSDTTLTVPSCGLSPSNQYAGEVLSFLLQIVLGQTGNPRFKKEWSTRGFEEKLDYEKISDIMTDPDASQLDLIVPDPGLQFLTRVLYHYDPTLSQYKGKFDFASIYPATEIVALRLLLLKKINEKEKINLEELIRREDLLMNPKVEMSNQDLEAVNLRADEMRFLRDILHEEPRLFDYLKSPFLVKGLVRVGAVNRDSFSQEMIELAEYGECRCSFSKGSKKADAIKIAVLPSIIGEFDFDGKTSGLSEFGFAPTEDLVQIFRKLEADILFRTRELLEKEACSGFSLKGIGKKSLNTIWDAILQNELAFYVEDKRPLVITPHNAAEVVSNVCPETDFTVILLDKNVYLTVNLNEKKDMYPAVPWIYLDIMDIQYSQAGYEIDEISRFICSRLEDRFQSRINREKVFDESDR